MVSCSNNIFTSYAVPYFRFLCHYYPCSVQYLSGTLLNSAYTYCYKDTHRFSNTLPSAKSNISCPDSLEPSIHINSVDLFYCNVRSLLPKSPLLSHYVSMYNPCIIALTETWLNNSTPSSLFCPMNYTPYRHDRTFARGGGALILVKDNVISTSLEILPSQPNTDIRIDAVACRLCFDGANDLGILCIYRPPDSSSEDNLLMRNIITDFLHFNIKNNIIVGDFNFPDINWPFSSSSNQSNIFLNFCQDNFLTQHVHSPTRRISNSILDLLFSTNGTCITHVDVHEEFGSSDHSIIQCSINIKPSYISKKSWRRCFKNTDWSLFQDLLVSSSGDWSSALHAADVDIAWKQFTVILNKILDKVAPYKLVTSRNFISNSKVRTALRYTRRAFKALVNNPSPHNLFTYERSMAIAQCALNCDLLARENYVCKSKDARLFWSYVNRRISTTSCINSISHLGQDICEPQRIANIFNEFFFSIFSTPSDHPAYAAHPDVDHDAMTLQHITLTLDDVLKAISMLPPKASIDSDGLSNKILKKGSLALATYLYQLFSLSLNSSRIPTSWKSATVTPIHKGRSKRLVENYRPISVTSCCSRLLERIINTKIQAFLSNNSKLNTSQHGFLKGKSTDTILLHFYDYVTGKVDKNLLVDCIFFDFKKAFDTVPHSLLLRRIYSMGISGSLFHWIQDFFSNRSQAVKIGSCLSGYLPVPSGVVQGSVLGPTLFNIFVNNIDDSLRFCNILKYADDTRIFLSAEKADVDDLMCKIQIDIDNLVRWSRDSGMAFNVSKCFSASFGHSAPIRHYTIGDTIVPHKSSFSDLGLTINSSLNFKSHTDSIVSKAFSKLGLINKIFKFKNIDITPQLFKAFVRPSLEYSSIIWCPYTSISINNIERVQRRMCRMIPSIRHLSYRNQLKSLHLISLRARRLRFQLISIFKIFKGYTDINFSDFFDVSSIHRTRGHNCHIITKHCRHNYRLHFFTVSAISLWNQLSQEDIDATSINIFKNKLVDFFVRMNIW